MYVLYFVNHNYFSNGVAQCKDSLKRFYDHQDQTMNTIREETRKCEPIGSEQRASGPGLAVASAAVTSPSVQDHVLGSPLTVIRSSVFWVIPARTPILYASYIPYFQVRSAL